MTTAVTARLIAQGRIGADETTVLCITGNGLKTTDCLAGRFDVGRAVRPRLTDFEDYLAELDAAVTMPVHAAEPEPELVPAD